MGVIDLDARVKKLEAGGGGGADPGVIDQLEAAVTDLEETVNGNGETDFGLVGDVAALEAAVPTVTDLSASLTGAASFTTSASLIKYGNLRVLDVLMDKYLPTTTTSAVTIPEGERPSRTIGAAVSVTYSGDVSKRIMALITPAGAVNVVGNSALANNDEAGAALHATWIVS